MRLADVPPLVARPRARRAARAPLQAYMRLCMHASQPLLCLLFLQRPAYYSTLRSPTGRIAALRVPSLPRRPPARVSWCDACAQTPRRHRSPVILPQQQARPRRVRRAAARLHVFVLAGRCHMPAPSPARAAVPARTLCLRVSRQAPIHVPTRVQMIGSRADRCPRRPLHPDLWPGSE